MEKKSGLKNEKKVQRILVSGSAVLPEKSANGIRLSKKQLRKPAPPMIKGYPDLSDIPTDSYGNLSEAGNLNLDEIDNGIVSGKLIRPKYDSVEIEKSIDTDIFELIPVVPEIKPPMVPKPLYDNALNAIADLTAVVEQLTTNVGDLTTKVSELEIVSESLKVDIDSEKLRADVASAQATISNNQLSEMTIDLSNAIQNSINEAVQRVSLEARNEALVESFRLQKELTLQREQENAAIASIEGVNGFFQSTENVGWKINPNDIKDESRRGLFVNTENRGDVEVKNGLKGVAFFNFTDKELTFKISRTGGTIGDTGNYWIEATTAEFKVPARSENTAGVTTARFRFREYNARTSSRKQVKDATFIINTSSADGSVADKLTLKAYYRKEVKRKNDWKDGSVRGSIEVTVGEDKTG